MVNEKELLRYRNEVLLLNDNVNKQRDVLFTRLNDKISEILTGFGDERETTITFDELVLFEIGKRNEVNDGVFFEKTYQDENKLVFLTYMLEGGGFGVHLHDCVEFCKILKGNLIERTRGYKKYEKGQTIVYAPDELHRPYATSESLYEVTFYKTIG